MQSAHIDLLAGLECGDRCIGLLEQRCIRRIGSQLFAQDHTQRAAGCGSQHDSAEMLDPPGRGQRDQPAFAMAQQPDAFLAGRGPCGFNPAGGVGDVVGDGDVIGIGHRRLAGEHSALVDPKRADPAFGERFGQQAIGGRHDSHRIVAVAIGHARTGDDEEHRLAFCGGNQCAAELALGSGSGQRLLRKRGCAASDSQHRAGEKRAEQGHINPPSWGGHVWAAW